MQRIAARAATSLVLAVALTLAATVSASASPSPRPIQRSASFRSTQRYVPSRFAIPSSRQLLERASGSATALIGNFKVLGSPYRWGFAAVTSGTRPFLIVFGGKTSSTAWRSMNGGSSFRPTPSTWGAVSGSAVSTRIRHSARSVRST